MVLCTGGTPEDSSAKQSRLHTAADLQSWRLALDGALWSSSCMLFIWDVVLSNFVLVEQRS